MYDGGDGSTLTRRQTSYKGAKNGGGGKVDKWHGERLKAFYGALDGARGHTAATRVYAHTSRARA